MWTRMTLTNFLEKHEMTYDIWKETLAHLNFRLIEHIQQILNSANIVAQYSDKKIITIKHTIPFLSTIIPYRKKSYSKYVSCLKHATFVNSLKNPSSEGGDERFSVASIAYTYLKQYTEFITRNILLHATELRAPSRVLVNSTDIDGACAIVFRKTGIFFPAMNFRLLSNLRSLLDDILLSDSKVSLSSDAGEQLSFLIEIIAQKICEVASGLAAMNGRHTAMSTSAPVPVPHTIGEKELESAIGLIFNNVAVKNLGILAVRVAKDNVRKYLLAQHEQEDEKKSMAHSSTRTMSKRTTRKNNANLCLNVPPFEKLIRYTSGGRISRTAPVFLTAICECLADEILTPASTVVLNEKKVIIQSHHLREAINADKELSALLELCNFSFQ